MKRRVDRYRKCRRNRDALKRMLLKRFNRQGYQRAHGGTDGFLYAADKGPREPLTLATLSTAYAELQELRRMREARLTAQHEIT